MASGLKLYNTLTREKEPDFEPIDSSNVRLYVCGPTVYDFAHIGNARPVIVFDVLYRLLRHVYGQAEVTYVRNITDVDDKINARALRDFPDLPLNEAIRTVTEKTLSQFQADVAALGCLTPTAEPRATDNIEQMKEIICRLIDKGHAYVAAGEVLFDTRSMPDYGQLSKRNLDEQQAGARVAVEAHKKNPGDFVLWKLSSHNEPGWDSPWGRGRPGWHIECSAMADRYLWEEIKDGLTPRGKARPHQFDIHGGGLDLIFPHHENEIAQSCCANGTSVMANVWMHNGFVQVEGRKMSKSDGNFITINELLGEGWDGRVMRFLMLKTHYRQPINWTRDGLQQAALELSKLANRVSEISPDGSNQSPDVLAALSDDLNTPQAIAELHSLAASTSRRDMTTGVITPNDDAYEKLANGLILLGFDDLLNFDVNAMFARVHAPTIDEAEINAMIQVRLDFLNTKNFGEADGIRNALLDKGIQLKDGKNPVTGERTTTWEVKR